MQNDPMKPNWSVRENGEANQFFILTSDGKWLASLQLNGEFTREKQEEICQLIAAAPYLQDITMEFLNMAWEATTEEFKKDVVSKIGALIDRWGGVERLSTPPIINIKGKA